MQGHDRFPDRRWHSLRTTGHRTCENPDHGAGDEQDRDPQARLEHHRAVRRPGRFADQAVASPPAAASGSFTCLSDTVPAAYAEDSRRVARPERSLTQSQQAQLESYQQAVASLFGITPGGLAGPAGGPLTLAEIKTNAAALFGGNQHRRPHQAGQ
jgi:hypothetical protein